MRLLPTRHGPSQMLHTFGRNNDLLQVNLTKLPFHSDSFCSHPTKACVEHLATTTAAVIPDLTYAFSPLYETGLPTPNITCLDNSTIRVQGVVSDPGMLYEFLGKVQGTNSNGGVLITCQSAAGDTKGVANATVTVSGASETWFTWVGGTNYDQNAGDAAHGFSFQGPDPHDSLSSLLASATAPELSYSSVLSTHTTDFTAILTPFALSIGQTPDLGTPTDQLVAAYKTDDGNPYIEWLLFNYGRYMLATSARGVLPANLQGKWANGISNAWSAGQSLSDLCSSF